MLMLSDLTQDRLSNKISAIKLLLNLFFYLLLWQLLTGERIILGRSWKINATNISA